VGLYRREFLLEAVTPMLLHGTDTGKPEIRTSSFKGMMRWTMRTLLGAMYSVDTVKSIDFFINGDTEHASLWKLSVLPASQLKEVKAGRFYKGYDSGTKIYVKLSSDSEDVLLLSVVIFGAMIRNFGVGQRWRHGYGKFKRINGDKLLSSDFQTIVNVMERLSGTVLKTVTLKPNNDSVKFPYVYVDENSHYAFTVDTGIKNPIKAVNDVKYVVKDIFEDISKNYHVKAWHVFGKVKGGRVPSRIIYRPLSEGKVRVIFLRIPEAKGKDKALYKNLLSELIKAYSYRR